MHKNRKKKIGVTAVSVSVLTLGAAGLSYAYQSGIEFDPNGTTRDMQENQIVFDQDENAISQTDKKKEDESKLWQKEDHSEDKTKSETEKNSNFLFEQAMAKQSENQQSIGIIGESGIVSGNNGTSSENSIYDIVSNPSNADLILNPNQNGISNGNSTNSGEQTGSGDDKNTGNTENDNPVNPSTKPDNPGSDQKENISATIRDPEGQKWQPSKSPGDNIPYTPYEEGMVPAKDADETGDSPSVIIQKMGDKENVCLYKGQSVDEKTIYYSLYTVVAGKDGKIHIWGADALDKYIRVEGISFDGGNTWNSEFPVTIPKDVSSGQMKIKVGYRFSQNDTQWIPRIVDYDPEDNRIFVLSKALTEEDTIIDKGNVLNYSQYFAEGEVLNLFGYQHDLLRDGELTSLFPGWKENGEFVPWFYTAESGRHILEPEDMVPLSDEYIVELKQVWMSDDYQVGIQYDNLCYLQTLVNVGKSAVKEETRGVHWFINQNYEVLEIPKYIQAVMIEDGSDIKVDYLKIPDTVLYIADTENNIQVEKGYEVEDDNPCYASLDDGVLTNKEKTELLNIPYKLESLEVDENVTKINISAKNKISKIEFQADSVDKLPELNYDNLSQCQIFVQEQILEDYLEQNADTFTKENDLRVASEENTKITYYVDNNAIISNQGKIRRVLKTGGSTLVLSKDVKAIEDGALESVSRVQTIAMPKNGQDVVFEEGCLNGSDVKLIRCYTEKQYQSVERQLEQMGVSQDIKVQLVSVSKEGYTYSSETEAGKTTTMILGAPEDVQEFDGIITSKDGEKISVTEIGEQAFANCENLEWVILPESVERIGYQAFKNCTSLAGVLINTKDTITIGNQSFDGCSHLRFLASNAEHGIMEDGYDPIIENDSDMYGKAWNYFYVPTNSDGYTENIIRFVEESGVAGFDVVDIGGDAKMLYGTDAFGSPWLGLRSGGETSEEVHLPEDTIEIFSYAMCDLHSKTGSFTVNWDELSGLWAFDAGAFEGSDLAGDISLTENSMVFEEVFADCSNISSMKILGDDIYIGPGVFQNCTNLTSVEFGSSSYNEALSRNLFNNCNKLSDITFDSEVPFTLMVSSMGSPFQFNVAWTLEEEKENLHIHVPAGSEEQYVKAWKYFFAGYYDSSDTPAYIQMWNDVQMKYMDWETWEFPSDEEVDVYVEEELLEAENRIRDLLDIPSVSEPTDFYPYRLSYEGELTLLGVPSNTKELDLGTADLGMLDGWYLDYIGSHAFSKAANMNHLVIPGTLVGIYTDAFEGVTSEHLTLTFQGMTPLNFMGWSTQNPFRFGVDESKITIEVPQGSEEDYIRALEFPLLGYTDLCEMQDSVRTELEEKGQTVTDDELKEEMAKRLIAVENRIRKMMGLSQINSVDELACEWNLNLYSTEENTAEEENSKELNEQQENTDNQNNDTGDSTSNSSETTVTDEKESGEAPETEINGETKENEDISSESMAGKTEETVE